MMVRGCSCPVGEKEASGPEYGGGHGGCQKRLDSGCLRQTELMGLLKGLEVDG